MNNKLNNLFIFDVGAALGSAVTWKITKDVYDRKNKEDIESVKEVLGRGHRTEINPVDDDADVETKPTISDISAYNKKVDEENYRNYSTVKE